ncbi:alpha/beta hydrolase [Pontibacter sp. G13]|uniref:alpha/beta hydrolase n=1 Tax=Pontibacter sp. G13 TaxID=3074898 RepID=UPI00288BF6BA|nr:alpha/beta hydrolase [Pontibacter sp. G13]WNJ16616.1 alpha/beta hydrolase [Pontibacter sp. G13]
MSFLPIHFSHANGFPADSYRYFLDQLAPHAVSAIPVTGSTISQPFRNWTPLVDELIDHIRVTYQTPILGLGHSLGGVLMLKASQRAPELFRGVALMDPPLLGWEKRLAISLAVGLKLDHRMNSPIKLALNRVWQFEDRAQAASYWGEKAFFSQFHPQCFEDYLVHGLIEHPDGGLQLRINREREAHIFRTIPRGLGPSDLIVPTSLFLPSRGVLTSKEIRRITDRFGFDHLGRVDESGHMFPLEKPIETAERLKAWFAEIS